MVKGIKKHLWEIGQIITILGKKYNSCKVLIIKYEDMIINEQETFMKGNQLFKRSE